MNTIKELADALQQKIDPRIAELCELADKRSLLLNEIKRSTKKMRDIIHELEPVESLILCQNPALTNLFEELKKV